MKYLTTILIAAMAIVLSGQALKAQEIRINRKQQQVEFLKNDLAVSHQTATAVTEIMETYRKNMRELFSDSTKTDEGRRKEIKDLIAIREQGLKALLSSEQLQKFRSGDKLQKRRPVDRPVYR